MVKPITTAADVVDALGGTRRTAVLLNFTVQRVSNWKKRNKLPPETYFAIAPELNRKGHTAPLCLWGFTQSTIVDATP